jgi:solute carrier family 25 carnitine/acylcarnitine transporter 20/29
MSEVPLASSLLEFAPGAIGGFFNVFVGHPMDLIKVRQQSAPSRTAVAAALAPESTTGMLRNIVRQDGWSGLYRGVASPLIAVTPAFAISFWSCDLAKSAIVDYERRQSTTSNFTQRDLSIGQVAAAGAFSGLPMAMVIGPSERIKCLMQVDKLRYNGFMDCAGQLYREGGLRSIFRGTGSAVLRDVPGNAAYFAGYEFFKRQFCAMEGRETPSTPSILVAGGLAGVGNWIIAIPFDTLKSRIQTAPTGMYKNYMDVLTQTVQKEGVQALFRGLTPALLRAFPANAACLYGVETARSVMNGWR